MTRKATFSAILVWAVSTLLLPTVAWAGSWGEIVFQLTSTTSIVRVVGHYDNVRQDLDAFRFLHKEGAGAWSESHAEADGVPMSDYQTLVASANESQPAFDLNASATVGQWYTGKTPYVQGMIRDATRRADGVGFLVRVDGVGNSCAATIADYDAMAAAAKVGDRVGFDKAAETAWDSWFIELKTEDRDLIYQIVIDHIDAG